MDKILSSITMARCLLLFCSGRSVLLRRKMIEIERLESRNTISIVTRTFFCSINDATRRNNRQNWADNKIARCLTRALWLTRLISYTLWFISNYNGETCRLTMLFVDRVLFTHAVNPCWLQYMNLYGTFLKNFQTLLNFYV